MNKVHMYMNIYMNNKTLMHDEVQVALEFQRIKHDSIMNIKKTKSYTHIQ